MNNKGNFTFTYKFKFQDETEVSFEIKLNNELEIEHRVRKEFPIWTMFDFFECPNCPQAVKSQHCPVALLISDIGKAFKFRTPDEIAEITVEANSRGYFKKTQLQSGISGLLGMMMVSSGCRIMGKLKPLLFFHLPFATSEETEVRVFSLYLLAQFIKWKKDGEPDWDFQNLNKIYEEIRKVNINISQRINMLSEKDTSINSLIILNNFAENVTFTISENQINQLEVYFKEFLK